MLITKQEILLQNQRDNQAFQGFSQAMREMLISEMEASREQQWELLSSLDKTNLIANKAA